MRQAIVHFAQRVDDKFHRRLERSGNAVLAHQALIALRPVLYPVAQPCVIDHDQQVVIELVALGRMGFVDPTAPRIRSV